MQNLINSIWLCIRFDGLKGLDFAKDQLKNGNVSHKDYKVIEAFYFGLMAIQSSRCGGGFDRSLWLHSLVPYGVNYKQRIYYHQIAKMGLVMAKDDLLDRKVVTARLSDYGKPLITHVTTGRAKRIMTNNNMDKYIKFCISYIDLL